MIRRLVVAVLVAGFSFVTLAQQGAAPTPEQHLGYALGDRFTPHHRIVEYFRAVDARSPLVTVEQYGESYEGRPLVYAVVTSERNHAELDAIRGDLATLAGGRTADANTASGIAKNRPAVVWLAYGVHGNESSSAEAAMRVLSTLVNDADARAWLENVIVIIDPLQNPDGRDRYVEWFRRTRGAVPNTNPDAAEHYEQWPGGRFNHYVIDMNRDWAWTSQKETRARVEAFRKWNPQVFVDLHEMFFNSSYFFPPTAKPTNANIPRDAATWLETFGKGNAEAFSDRGWPFFVGERFDLFYPGYGDAWPSLNGAIGMTYEMAGHGRAGLGIEREDGTVLTLADRIDRHYTSSIATVKTAAANREALLMYTWNAMRAPFEGQSRPTYFIAADAPQSGELVSMLRRQGIEVGVLRQEFPARAQRVGADASENRTFPAGTYVVSARQRLGSLVQTLLERTPAMQQEFVQEQREKAEADLPEDFYDITAWSLPLAMNVDAWSAQVSAQLPVDAFVAPPARSFRPSRYAYLVDAADPEIYRFVGRLLKDEVRFSIADQPVDIAGRKFSRGTLIIFKSVNGDGVDARLQRILGDLRVDLVPVDAGWTGGTALGSESVRNVKRSRIALIGGAGTNPTSFGMLWHTLDVDTPIPHTVISLDTLGAINLSRYDVILMPDGNYVDRISKSTTEKLQHWLRGGGTIVAVRGASSYLRAKDVEMSKLKPWEAPKKKDEETPAADERYNQFSIPGAIFRTSMNEQSYLTFGVQKAPNVLIEGTAAYQPVSHRVDNIVTVDSKDALVSGIAWPESLERIQGSVYLVSEPYGRGQVITFADEPHFRLFWRGTLPMLMNAVLYSPSFPR